MELLQATPYNEKTAQRLIELSKQDPESEDEKWGDILSAFFAEAGKWPEDFLSNSNH